MEYSLEKLPEKEEIEQYLREAKKNLGIECSKEDISNLVMYEMTDGTRTSNTIEGEKAYVDGGLFILRFIRTFSLIGGKNLFVNVIHEGHKKRVNYKDIYAGMEKLVDVYRKFSNENNIRLRFIGKYDENISPEKNEKDDIRKALRQLEKETEKNTGLTVHFLINYSTRWASEEGKEFFSTLPAVNVIIRHCKGYVNGDMWLHGKLNENSFLYVQNGSSSENWSNRQIVYLISLALRSMLLNQGTHLLKKYKEGENAEIRQKREIELSFIHKSFHSQESEKKFAKRIIIFSSIGPEVYEF